MFNQTTEETISSMQSQIDHNSALAQELEEKIARLETAKTAVGGSYDDFKSSVDWVNNYDVGRSWLGKNREDFEAKKTETKEFGDTLCSNVQYIYDQICGKLEALNQELCDCRASTASINLSLSFLYMAL